MGIPVKVFRSTDTDAPQIAGGRGDVKMVLKACLVSGYGSGDKRKEPLGWEIVAGTETADGFFRESANLRGLDPLPSSYTNGTRSTTSFCSARKRSAAMARALGHNPSTISRELPATSPQNGVLTNSL